jgi:hypothetical protein
MWVDIGASERFRPLGRFRRDTKRQIWFLKTQYNLLFNL